MSEWTFGGVKARNMALEAYCQNEECRRFFVFNLDQLIEALGEDYLVSDIPPLTCEACGGLLAIKLALNRLKRTASLPARRDEDKDPSPARLRQGFGGLLSPQEEGPSSTDL